MTVQQDDPRSWAPTTVPAEPDSAAALLSDLSNRRPRAHAPAPVPEATTPLVPTPRTDPAPPLMTGPGPDPSGPGFSPDGRFWWDGKRWTPTDALERKTVDDATTARRRWPVALLWAGLGAAILAVLFLAALPVLWDRGGDSDEVLQTALLEVAEAQQRHLVDHGRYAADADSLALYLVRLGGLPPEVTVDVRAADDLTYCVAGTSTDGATLWVSASGAVSTTPCG